MSDAAAPVWRDVRRPVPERVAFGHGTSCAEPERGEVTSDADRVLVASTEVRVAEAVRS